MVRANMLPSKCNVFSMHDIVLKKDVSFHSADATCIVLSGIYDPKGKPPLSPFWKKGNTSQCPLGGAVCTAHVVSTRRAMSLVFQGSRATHCFMCIVVKSVILFITLQFVSSSSTEDCCCCLLLGGMPSTISAGARYLRYLKDVMALNLLVQDGLGLSR